jgi:DNA-binding MarR family transcriptional regulator
VVRHKNHTDEARAADPAAARSRRERSAEASVDHDAYCTLAEFRYLLRRFLTFSQEAARHAGLSSRHHQALLAIKGFSGKNAPTVGDLAERLCIRHHSAVELVDRLAEAGLIDRLHDTHDRRRVFLLLTATAEQRLIRLSAAHLEELHRLRPVLLAILDRIGPPAQGA